MHAVIPALVFFLAMGVVCFTHLDAIRANKKLAAENDKLKKEVNLLSDTVVKENP